MAALATFDTSYESSLAIFDVSYEEQFTAISVASPTDSENVVGANVTITAAQTAEPTIYVIPKDPSGGWRHFLIQLNDANGQQPNFEVENNRVSNFAPAWVPLYTYDFETWNRGSSYTLDTGTTPGRYKFQFDEAFNQNTVWVASHPVLRQADWVSLVNDLLTNRSSVASATASGDASAVIGQSLSNETDTSTDPDRDVGPFDMHAVKLDWGGSTTDGAEKRQMAMLVGSHSGEVIDGEMVRGALNWMLDDSSTDAQRFRSNWIVYLYGLHAPNGRWAGESRVNPHRAKDPNRDWSATDFDLTESVTIRDAIEADMEVGGGGSKDMHAFFSFHGAGLSTDDILYYPAFGSTDESAYSAFKTALEGLDSDPVVDKSPIDDALASRWMHEQYGAQVAVAPEGQMEADPDPARYREVGGYYVQAVSIADGQGEFVAGTADNAVITSASATPLASTDTSTATDSAQITSVTASVLSATDTGAATDTATLTSASAAVLTATAQSIASDAAAIITAAATPLTSTETVGGAANNVADSAVITTVGSATLTATDAAVSTDGATITPASVTIRTGTETASALDNALIVNAQGTPIASVESVQTDARITTVTVTPLTAVETTGTAQILLGTPGIEPALNAGLNTVPVFRASPAVVAQLKANLTVTPE